MKRFLVFTALVGIGVLGAYFGAKYIRDASYLGKEVLYTHVYHTSSQAQIMGERILYTGCKHADYKLTLTEDTLIFETKGKPVLGFKPTGVQEGNKLMALDANGEQVYFIRYLRPGAVVDLEILACFLPSATVILTSEDICIGDE